MSNFILSNINPFSPLRYFSNDIFFLRKKRLSFDMVLHHSIQYESQQPLKIFIQGTVGEGKCYCIHCISNDLYSTFPIQESPLRLLAPTSLIAFNICARTIHSTLIITNKSNNINL